MGLRGEDGEQNTNYEGQLPGIDKPIGWKPAQEQFLAVQHCWYLLLFPGHPIRDQDNPAVAQDNPRDVLRQEGGLDP